MNETLKKEAAIGLKASLFRRRGCAFLGQSDFDRLGFVKDCLSKEGLIEYNPKTSEGDFVVVDCRRQRKSGRSMEAIVQKYKELPCVILNNSERIFSDEVLILFKRLGDDCLNREGLYSTWNQGPRFIFIGDKNPFPEAYEKAHSKRKRLYPDMTWEGSEESHISVFFVLYDVFDLETGKRKHFPYEVEELDVDLYDIPNPALASHIKSIISEINDEETGRLE
jgi:hypothetical protein